MDFRGDVVKLRGCMYIYIYIYMDVSENSGTPKSSILIGFSPIFTIHFGIPQILETPIWKLKVLAGFPIQLSFFHLSKKPRSQRPDKGLSLVKPGQWDHQMERISPWDEVYRYIYRSTDERLEFST